VYVDRGLCAWQPGAEKASAEVVVRGVAGDVDDRSDLLQNLLGVTDAHAIDTMLDSADRAAALLGVKAELNSATPAAGDVTVWQWPLMT